MILVGKNGSGKSTILDALLIAASPVPADAIGRVVLRRQVAIRGARWLLWKVGSQGPAEIDCTSNGSSRKHIISVSDAPNGDFDIRTVIKQSEAQLHYTSTRIRPDNSYAYDQTDHYHPPGTSFVRFVETRLGAVHAPLHTLFTDAAEQGRKQYAITLAQRLIPGASTLEILTDDNRPYLSIAFADRNVPVEFCGDGTQAIVRLALELAIPSSGMAILEEPEVHLHPAAIELSAQAIVETVRHGVQVVLSTHSLELIDAILSQASVEDLGKACLFRTRLDDGALLTSRLSGLDASEARTQIDDELR